MSREEEEEEEAIRALKQRERGGEKDTQPRFYGTAAAVSETRNDPRPKPTTFFWRECIVRPQGKESRRRRHRFIFDCVTPPLAIEVRGALEDPILL